VIGYDVWQTRFASDPDIVGRDVRLGNAVHTVVGVMPEGFAFPINHRFWVPLRVDPSDYERRQGPGIFVFGRLAPSATLDGAQAELTTVGLRAAAAFPETHERLHPRIVPYTLQLFDDMMGWEIPFVHFLITTLLVVVCVNVAILVYARTATRVGEIAVRSALGASRRRIVGQLFVEALVLSAAAAAVGLVVARLALKQVDALIEQLLFMPFWFDFGLSSGTVVYVLALTVLTSVIVGVLPAVKATGRQVQAGLQLAMGGSRMQLGGTWTALIVVQVTFAVAVLPMALFLAWTSIQYGIAEPGFAAEEFLTARLVMDWETPPSAEAEAYRLEFASGYADRYAELVRRLEAEPAVSDVTFASRVPGEEMRVLVETDGVSMPTESVSDSPVRWGSAGLQVRFNRVDVNLFDVFDVPILTGRRFHSGDLDTAATAVIVNRTFVQQVLGDDKPLGRRVRYVGIPAGDARPGDVELERWYEIVGVVTDFPNAMEPGPGHTEAKLYHPMAPGQVYGASLALRVQGGTSATFAGRLREITAALDPTLRLDRILPLDDVLRQEQSAWRMGAMAIALVTLSVLLLSATGIYALMSFTVTQRRREIGIRTALGAHPHRILGSIFSRALVQLAIGVVLGALAAALLDRLTGGELGGGEGAVLLPAVAVIMMVVGLLAAVGPARRGLRIQPTEALRADG
jgi:predicted permease